MPLLSSGSNCPFRAITGDRSTKTYPSEHPKSQASLLSGLIELSFHFLVEASSSWKTELIQQRREFPYVSLRMVVSEYISESIF